MHRLGTVSIPEEAVTSVVEVLRSNRVSPGARTQEFEAAYARAHSHKYGAFVNSGQTAIELALRALGILIAAPAARVLLPATTYISTWAAIKNAGMLPRFCDVGEDLQINLDLVRRPYDILLPVHLYGVTKSYPGKYVIEDACEASFGRNVGAGLAACHSFYASHLITTGSGGMVTSNDEEFITLVRRLANHGRAASAAMYVSNDLDSVDVSRAFIFDQVGTSSKCSDILAALGLGQIDEGKRALKKRRSLSSYLRAQIMDKSLSHIKVPPLPDNEEFTFLFPVVAASRELKIKIVSRLNSAGVQTRDAMPLVTQPVVQWTLKPGERYPTAERLAATAFHVGIHQDLTFDDLDSLVELL